jgi:hypothetical protein
LFRERNPFIRTYAFSANGRGKRGPCGAAQNPEIPPTPLCKREAERGFLPKGGRGDFMPIMMNFILTNMLVLVWL